MKKRPLPILSVYLSDFPAVLKVWQEHGVIISLPVIGKIFTAVSVARIMSAEASANMFIDVTSCRFELTVLPD